MKYEIKFHIMKRVCAWCGITIGFSSVLSREDITSHGICKDCKDKMWKEHLDFQKTIEELR